MNKPMPLDEEEQEILDAYEAGTLKPVTAMGEELARHKDYARATFRKDRQVRLRIANRDFAEIQKRALAEGVSYQSLIGSILHKFVEQRFVEKPAE